MKGIFTTYLLPAVLFLFIGLVGYGLVGQIGNAQERSEDLDALEEELAGVVEENKHLESAIEASESEDIIDREARERLNLKKEGEKVVVILPDQQTERIDDEALLELLEEEIEEYEEEDERLIDKIRYWLQRMGL